MKISAESLRNERDKRGLSQKDFAEFLGVGFRTYQNYEAGKVIPDSKKELLAYKLDNNIANDEKASYEKPEGIWVNYESFMMVPLVHHRAQAGFLSNYGDPEYIEDLPKVPFEVDKEYRGKYVCFEVTGDSMNDGTFNSILEGDILLCRDIQRLHWKNKLHLHTWSYYVIVHRDQGILVKEITSHNIDNGILTLHSLNDLYEDQNVKMDDLIGLYNVVDFKRKPIKR